jgi:aerobic carbon-monoxide dehydrogenase large subunit
MSATNGAASASGNGAKATKTHVGQALRRKEDPRLITGKGTYVDDITLHRQLWAAWVRSPEAHAKIVSIDTSAAKARKGVHAVFTNEDLDMPAPLPMAWVPPGVEVKTPEHWVLAKGEVKHIGDPVALVIGDDRYGVIDAVEDVVVEYDPLPVITDPEKALEDGSPLVHESLGSNKICEWSLGGGDLDAGFAEADVIVERRVVNHRTAGGAIEPRGVLAEFRHDKLTVWSSTQVPHFLRLFLSMLLGVSEEKVRVIAPEVGGGFGSKLNIYAEEIGCAWASRKLGRPIKWIETRSEGLMVTHHGRDQIDYVRAGAKRDGTLTAFHAKIIADCGAYQMLLTPMIPPLSGFVMCGVYKTPAVQTDIIDVMTNKFPTDAIRGAGRPEATHMIEVVMDQLAEELGMDRLELRRKNFIPPFQSGHETPIGVVYDSGDYDATLDKLLEHIDPAQVKSEAETLRAKGIYRGIGFSTYTEICGNAPSRIVGPGGFGLQGGGWESATVRVHASGTVTLYTGTSPHGQGHETGFAQIVADKLGIDPSQVEVIHGDTQTGPFGLDTYGARPARSPRRLGRSSPTSSRPRRRTSSCRTGNGSSEALRTRA